MTIFEAKLKINKSVTQIYTFLADLNNHQQLMPENVTNWSSTKDEARFAIQNMANLKLNVSNRIENSTIIVPATEAPFNIELRWVTVDLEDEGTEVILTLSADLNMMMKIMASTPLQKFTDFQVDKLKYIFA